MSRAVTPQAPRVAERLVVDGSIVDVSSFASQAWVTEQLSSIDLSGYATIGSVDGKASINYVDNEIEGVMANIQVERARIDFLDSFTQQIAEVVDTTISSIDALQSADAILQASIDEKPNFSYVQNAANITSGTIADARLSSNVARLNQANTFTGNVTCPAGNGGLRAGGIAVGHTLPVEGAIAGGQISNWSSGVQKQAIVATQGLNLASDTGIRWSSTTSSQGGVDSTLGRGSTGTVDALANNGFRSRNLANTADAPISCSTVAATVSLSTNTIYAGGSVRAATDTAFVQIGANNADSPLLYRYGSHSIELRNGVNGHRFRVNKTWTSSTNYEGIVIDASSDPSNYRIASDKGSAAGSTRGIQFGALQDGAGFVPWVTLSTSGNATFSNTIQTLAPGNTLGGVPFAATSSLNLRPTLSSRTALTIRGLVGQSVSLIDIQDSTGANRLSVTATYELEAAVKPIQIADASASNGSVYYSTDVGKLVFKDLSGVVNSLY